MPASVKKDTPLHCAATKGRIEICKYIISNVEDKNLAINAKNNDNDTPIDLAASRGHHQAADFLRSIIEN